MVVIIVKALFEAVRNQIQKSATIKIASSITSAITATQEPLEMSPSKFQLVILKHYMKHEDRISNLTMLMILCYSSMVHLLGVGGVGGGGGDQEFNLVACQVQLNGVMVNISDVDSVEVTVTRCQILSQCFFI